VTARLLFFAAQTDSVGNVLAAFAVDLFLWTLGVLEFRLLTPENPK